MTNKNKTARAFEKYGFEVCQKAYEYAQQGYGSAGIANECNIGATLTVRQVDAAVAAYRHWLSLNTLGRIVHGLPF